MAALLPLRPAAAAAATSLSLLSPTPTPLLLLPPKFHCQRYRQPLLRRKNTIFFASASPSTRGIPCPALDRHATRHNRLRFVKKLTTLLLSKPRHFLPLRILSRCRSYLRPTRPLLRMILRYPAIFHLFQSPSATSPVSLSLLSVGLTPAAAALAEQESQLRSRIASSLADKLQRLLMLSSHRRLLLSKLVHLAPDLGLPPNFRSSFCARHPDRFRLVNTSYGWALELVAYDPALAVPLPPPPDNSRPSPIIDRPPKFRQLKLRKGLNLKRRHRDYLFRFQDLPEVSPYSSYTEALEAGLAEKRACAVVREVLAMTVERQTLVDHLTHFRKEFGLPNKLRGMLVRHPEMFYVSLKGTRDSVFLVEGYDDKGRLVAEDELLAAKERLLELVREGKRMRRERRKNTKFDDEDDDDEDEGGGLVDDGCGEEDDLDDLFESGIGDDWEEFSGVDFDGLGIGEEGGGGEDVDVGEFWSLKFGEKGGQLGELDIW